MLDIAYTTEANIEVAKRMIDKLHNELDPKKPFSINPFELAHYLDALQYWEIIKECHGGI